MSPNHYFYKQITSRGTLHQMKIQRIFTSLRLRKWIIGLVILLVMSLFVMNNYYTTRDNTGSFSLERFIVPNNNTRAYDDGETERATTHVPAPIAGYLVKTQGCRIPAVDPFDPAIKPFVKKEKPIVCEAGTEPPLVDSNDTAIYINFEALGYYYNSTEELQCCWRSFWRTGVNDDEIKFNETCNSFNDSATMTDEFIKVECSTSEKIIYKDYHAFLPLTNPSNQKIKSNNKKDKLNVLILGIDAVSRLNFHRSMPKTMELLKNLGSIELWGYTKIDDNTYPNLVTVLSGVTEAELRDVCLEKKKTYDDCPFIWKNFSAQGYKTVLAEDAHYMTIFNYLKPGFHIQPTDYYIRPYMVASENDLGNTKHLNAHLCIGTRKTFDNLLDYVSKVTKRFQMTDESYFALIWEASLTHDFLNYPQLGDQSYSNLIKSLNDGGHLNNTVLIVMSDHGMRWGEFRQTYYGKLEDSLPFVFFKFPNWWMNENPIAMGNLRRNVRSLTSPFDLHETLLDILNPKGLIEDRKINRMLELNEAVNIPRGISLFFPIPDYRTCDHAQIPDHWCVCHSSNDVPLNDTTLKGNVKFLINQLNEMLSKYPQCARLTMDSMKSAKMWVNDEKKNLPWIDYTITFQTYPGNAIFEGTVRYGDIKVQRQLIGTIARLNTYGTQSACVDNFHLRLYCYCF